jgi:hypothetical protein
MEDRIADWTSAVVFPTTELEVAETVTEPRAEAVASPPPVIDATVLLEEDQVTEPVMSFTLRSENVPVAVNCWTVPRSNTGSAGVTAIETNWRGGGEPPTPGPKLPPPQALNMLRHRKIAGARHGLTEVFGLGTLPIAKVFSAIVDELGTS